MGAWCFGRTSQMSATQVTLVTEKILQSSSLQTSGSHFLSPLAHLPHSRSPPDLTHSFTVFIPCAPLVRHAANTMELALYAPAWEQKQNSCVQEAQHLGYLMVTFSKGNQPACRATQGILAASHSRVSATLPDAMGTV